jgi:hypothetical protein
VSADSGCYVAPALSAWSTRSYGTFATIVVALTLAACGGGGARQDASEPSGNFPVQVASASFPASQRLAEHTHLVISVRNSGTKAIPNIAVTICNVTCTSPAPAGEGTASQAFAEDLSQPNLANPSRPVWVVDRPPGKCTFSCLSGGPGGSVTATSNTWTLGPLAPGATAKFDWTLTAVRPGKHVVAWEIAAGLTGKAKAVLSDGSIPHSAFTVTIAHSPSRTYVTDSGKIVQQP